MLRRLFVLCMWKSAQLKIEVHMMTGEHSIIVHSIQFNYSWWTDCGWDPLLTTTTKKWITTTTLVVEECIWPQQLSFLLVQSVEWRQTIYGFKWKVCLRVTASYKPSPILWPWSSLSVSNSDYKQNGAKVTRTITTTPNYTLYRSWASKNSCGCDGCHHCTFSFLISQK